MSSYSRMCKAGVSLLAVLFAGGSFSGCGPSPASPPVEPVHAAPLPALDHFESEVREQLQAAHDRLEAQLESPRSDARSRALAYGDLGMRLHAYELLAPAQEAYRSAREADPADRRWPYLEAEILARQGDPEAAVKLYQRTLELSFDYLPALVALGRLRLEQDRPDDSREAFERALRVDDGCAAALVGLARLERRGGHEDRAAPLLEQALKLQPAATAIHYELALVYRTLGDTERAAQHLENRGKHKAGVRDPIRESVDALRNDARSRRVQGGRLLQQAAYDKANELLAEVALQTPEDPLVHLYLGQAQANIGETAAAIASFERTLELSPGEARAHLFIASLAAMRGADPEAAKHFEMALSSHPDLGPALLGLGRARLRLGDAESALTAYVRAVETDPGNAKARLGRAASLLRMQRFAEARQALEQDVSTLPRQVAFSHLLARLLAAAPEPSLRDGTRALALAQELARTMRNTDLAQTLAMALAELGRYAEAVSLQSSALEFAGRAGADTALIRRRLEDYEAGRTCREPWSPADAIFHPAPEALYISSTPIVEDPQPG